MGTDINSTLNLTSGDMPGMSANNANTDVQKLEKITIEELIKAVKVAQLAYVDAVNKLLKALDPQ